MVTQFVVAVGLLLSLLFVACSDSESAPQSGDETAAQVVPDPAQPAAGDEVSEQTADPEPTVPVEQREPDADESQSEPTDTATDEPATPASEEPASEEPASEEPASEEPATEELAVPLPDWAIDAVELTVERRLPSPNERLLVLWGCTHCDVATGEVGSWVGGEEVFDTGLERTLFRWVQRGNVAVSPDGDQIALLLCDDGCGGEGQQPLTESLYVSRDAGWLWEEIALPEDAWGLEGFTPSGDLILRRFGPSGTEPQQFHLKRTEYAGEADELVPVEFTPFDRIRPTTALDNAGLRWSCSNPDRDLPYAPRYALFHGDDLVRDFEQYAVSGLALHPEWGWATAGLICGARGPAGPDLTQCHDSFLTNAYLLNVIGDRTVAYKTDLASVLPDAAAADTPGFHSLRWQQRRTLWAELVSFQPYYTGRPVLIDFVAAHVTVFSEEQARFGDIVPLSFGPGQVHEVPLRLVPAATCVDLFPMPRERAGEEPTACVADGVLTGEFVVDAGGEGWYFVVAADASGWTSLLTAGLALD